MQDLEFPIRVDDPPYIGFLRADDFFTISLPFWIGFFCNAMLLGTLFGIALVWPMRKYRESHPDGHIKHLLWWYGLLPVRARGLVSPFLRRILPV